MEVGTPHTPPPSNELESQTVSELVSALRAASREEDFGRVEAALAAREEKLQREIARQRHENAVLEGKREFERLEKLRAEDELKQQYLVKEEAESEGDLPEVPVAEKEEGIVVISEVRRRKLRKNSGGNVQRRRSERLASNQNIMEINNNNTNNSSAKISGYRKTIKKQVEIKRGKNKMGKMRKKARGEEYVQYRCNLLSFYNTMQRIKDDLTGRHLELLKQTPFWPLVSAFYYGVISEDQCRKSEGDVLTIIKCYNPRTMQFEFGSVSVSLTAGDVAEILGLPDEGEELRLKGSRKYESEFTKRYFDVKRVGKTMVDDALDDAVKGKSKTNVEDVVRLIAIELCITFLLCNSGNLTSWNLVRYCEDLESISRYSWAKTVADYLHKSMKKRASRSKPYSAAGCVVLVLLWLCEKTNLVHPIRGREGQTPALVKWNMYELHLKLQHMDVEDIGLSFKGNKKVGENVKSHEEAIVDRREEGENVFDDTEITLEDERQPEMTREEGESVFDDTEDSLENELQVQTTRTKFLRTPTISKRLNNDNEGKRSEDLWETIQNASAQVADAQGKVSRLTEKLEAKKVKTKKLKRKLKREKKEKRMLKEDNEMLNAEKKSLFQSVKKVVKKLEKTLEAEREEVKNLKKEKMELIKENQELRDRLNQGSSYTATQSRADMRIEVSTEQSNLARPERSIMKRALGPEFQNERGGEKKRKVDKEDKGKKKDVQSDGMAAGAGTFG